MYDLRTTLQEHLTGRYRLEREVGAGGMAHVFLAEDVKHRRKVAIKVLRPDIASAVGAERFLREIDIAATLNHPHILPLHDSGQFDGLLYYVMPFVDGESLRDRLTREGRIPARDAARIAGQVADALASAHRRGIVHRDIKPENIMLSGGHALVADFGIARALSEVESGQLTRTGVAVGTVYYMSPEQASGDPIDVRSDVFSLGAVMYEMLAGRRPFDAPNAQGVLMRIIADPAPELTEADASRDLADIVRKCLSREPRDRFASGAELAAALDGLARSASTAAAGPAARGWRPRRALMGLSTAAALAAGAVLWSALHRPAVDASGSANRVAVLPFTVHGGPHLDYLSQGIVDLLSRNMEGVDDLSAIDPGTVISSLRKGGTTQAVYDARAGRDLGRRFGAGSFVVGSVNAVGPRLRIQAELHGAADGDDGAPLARGSVEGDTTELLALVDRLAAQLLVNRRSGAAERLSRTAAITTHSLPALKAFLNAEQKLRGRALDSAISGYQRAIAEDSTFALAYYRLAVAAGWSERHGLANDAAARGVALASRLTERDRRLITAYAAYRRGEVDQAERAYREVLNDFPDDLEAEFQLGDLLFQYNPLRGRPRLEARPLLDKVLALDPGFL